MLKQIIEDLNKRISAQPDSRCASGDEVSMAWLIAEIERLQRIVDEQKRPSGAMKIIAVDNFDREDHSDSLVCENIGEYHGKRVVDFLNSKEGEHSPVFFKLVPDDHKLYIFEP